MRPEMELLITNNRMLFEECYSLFYVDGLLCMLNPVVES